MVTELTSLTTIVKFAVSEANLDLQGLNQQVLPYQILLPEFDSYLLGD